MIQKERIAYHVAQEIAPGTLVTGMDVFEVVQSRLVLKEIVPGLTLDDLTSLTKARFDTADDLATMAEPHVARVKENEHE